ARFEDRVEGSLGGSTPEAFDEVVLATHSDPALRMLGDGSDREAPIPGAAPDQARRRLGDASDREHEILGAIPYQPNEAVLHTDRSLLPRRRRAWASWNYHLLDEPIGKPTVTYHMNRLQTLE